MRWRPLLWLCLSVLFFVAAAYFWHLGNEREARKGAAPPVKGAPPANAAPPTNQASVKAPKLTGQSPAATTQSASSAGVLGASAQHAAPASRFAYRLSNTKKSVGELAHDDKAI